MTIIPKENRKITNNDPLMERVLALKAECVRAATRPEGEGEDRERVLDLVDDWTEDEWEALVLDEDLMDELISEVAAFPGVTKEDCETVLKHCRVAAIVRGPKTREEIIKEQNEMLSEAEYEQMVEEHMASEAYELEEGDEIELAEDYAYFQAGTKGILDAIVAFPIMRDEEHCYMVNLEVVNKSTGNVAWMHPLEIPVNILKKVKKKK